jgi:adenylate cyclase
MLIIDAGLVVALVTGPVMTDSVIGNSRLSQGAIYEDDDQSVPMNIPPEAQLEQLLQQRRQYPQRVFEVDAEIERRFAQTRAIFILDMVGLTSTTQDQGIIPALEAIYHLREVAVPILAQHGGRLLKAEADNLFGEFDTPEQALTAAVEILNRLQAIDLGASIGIGYGEVLAVGDQNLYGDQVNVASRLGEDLAGPNEILMTESAYGAIDREVWQFESRRGPASHQNLHFYRLVRP